MKYFFLLLFLAAFRSETSGLTEACRENETQADLNSCARIKWQSADNALHEFTSGYIERLDPNQAELFNSAHAKWLESREAYCEFESSGVLGGSAYPMVFAGCMESQSKKRLLELRELSRCQEGDLSCPAWSSAAVPNNSFKPKPLRGSA